MTEATIATAGRVRRVPVLADLVDGTWARDALLVGGGAALTGLAAQVAVPLPGSPVPVTGQTFAVLLTGAALGWRRGAASMLLYVVVGAAGVPWFAAGESGMDSPTTGYLLGFVLAAALAGWLAGYGADRRPWRVAGLMVAGNAVIYLAGVCWLVLDLRIGLGRAVAIGLTPFLLGDAVKVLLASGALPTAWRLVGRGRADDAGSGSGSGEGTRR